MDEADALGEHVDFRTTDLAVERRELAVHVRDAHIVEIDQSESADAAAGECFDRPRADATDADDADVRAAQALESARAVEPGDAAETLREIFLHALLREVCLNGFARDRVARTAARATHAQEGIRAKKSVGIAAHHRREDGEHSLVRAAAFPAVGARL